MKRDQIDLLDRELGILDDAASVLKRSYELCLEIGEKENYSLEELDRFEALTSRFARLADIITQKLLRLIDELDLESPGTIRDRINRAAKKGIISSADSFAEIRELRNAISHEYLPQVLREIFKSVMRWSPELLQAVVGIKTYCKRFENQPEL